MYDNIEVVVIVAPSTKVLALRSCIPGHILFACLHHDLCRGQYFSQLISLSKSLKNWKSRNAYSDYAYSRNIELSHHIALQTKTATEPGLLSSNISHVDCTEIQVSQPDDFARLSPEGGCQLACDCRLVNCGHRCQARCHSESMHQVFNARSLVDTFIALASIVVKSKHAARTAVDV